MEVQGSWVKLRELRRKKQRLDSLAQLPSKGPEYLVRAEGNLPRFPGVLGLAGNQSPGWLDSGPRIQRGGRRRGPRGGEGEVSVNHIN